MQHAVTEAEPLAWTPDFVLGFTQMDDLHVEFVDIVGRLQAAQGEDLPALLDELHAHCKVHFDEENAWMTETSFPPRDCHIEEHGKVLASIEEVRRQAHEGIYAFCRSLADELANWFPGHATHLDSALAHWMCKQRFGGKPVVFRLKPRG